MIASLGGLEPPTFRLTAERANRLRHRDKMKLVDLFNHCYMSYIYYILIYIAQTIIQISFRSEGDTSLPPCVLRTALLWHCVLRTAILWPRVLRTV